MGIDTGDIVRVVLTYDQVNSSDAQNVFMFEAQSGENDDADILADWVYWAESVWGPDWVDFASQDVTLVQVDVDTLNVDGTVKANIGSATLAEQGSIAADPSGSANAGYILAATAVPKTRGSKYVPGPSELDTSDNLITGDALADLALLLLTLVSLYEGDTTGLQYLPGVLSRTLMRFEAFNETGYITDVPAYQRRRKRGVGS